jgi:hypothetical protein
MARMGGRGASSTARKNASMSVRSSSLGGARRSAQKATSRGGMRPAAGRKKQQRGGGKPRGPGRGRSR